MKHENLPLRSRLVAALFEWRKGYDKRNGTVVMEARNPYGHFVIRYEEGIELYQVDANSIEQGFTCDTLDEAYDYCIQLVRGMILKSFTDLFILGLEGHAHHRAGKWSAESIQAFVHDQFHNELDVLSKEELTLHVEAHEYERSQVPQCQCEICQEVFGDDEALPGDPDADMDDDQATAVIYAFGDTKKPIIH